MNFRSGKRYSAQKVKRGDIVFASKLEAALYDHLWLMEQAGRIRIEKLQDNVYLSEARVLYIADFRVFDLEANQTIWVEAKGYSSARWPMVKRLWRTFGPGTLKIYNGIYKKSGIHLLLVETIVPTQQLSLTDVVPCESTR